MGTFRTPETEAKYDAVKATGALERSCPLCDERKILQEFTHWHIVENIFPYDAIARVHHMLVSKRHIPTAELSKEEAGEYEEIQKGYVYDNYEFIIEPTPKRRSIPEHSHLHLIIAKDIQVIEKTA